MPEKKEWKEPDCEVLLLVRSQPMKGKASTKGLNKIDLRVVRWFKGEPKLENRHLFLHEDTGIWAAVKNLGIGKEEWDFIFSDPSRVKAVGEALHRK